MKELGIIPTLFYPLGYDEQGISANMQKAKDLTHRDSILWHTIHNYASWHIWKARCSAEFKQEHPTPTLLPLLRSLTSEELQSTKSSTFTIGIDGGKLDLN